VERRLTTMMAADLVGYSRLMAADEEGTISRLREARVYVVDPAVLEGGGRIVKTMGDGYLVEFPSPVAAVRAAVAMQRNLISREALQRDDRRLRFRIGIHLGDVVVDGEDILGDCVNITARLETIAPAGGICISRAVYDHVQGKIEAPMMWIGPQSVKNIPEPVDVWQVEVEGTSPNPVRLSGQARASIAVLPFQNFSAAPDQDHFVDGLVEDVITELSRFRWLFVIARNSTFAYKGTAKDVRKIAQELGVRYIVEGSVRRSGNRFRITAQLIDAQSGAHIWAERWDRPIADFFDVQDEIARRIIAGIEPELGAYERGLALSKPTDNLTAWEFCHRGIAELLSFEAGSQVTAERFLRQALEHDPNFALPYAYLARHRYALVLWGRAEDVPVAIEEGLSFATKALEIDRRNDIAHAMMSLLLTVAGRAV
jgi:adenylate cyclase